MPTLLKYSPADYPAAAKEQQLEAEVIVKLDIDIDGKVRAATIHKSAGDGPGPDAMGFDAAALAAAPGLTFQPARKADGNPVRVLILFKYTFELKHAPQPTRADRNRQPATTRGGLAGVVARLGDDAPLAAVEVRLTQPANNMVLSRSTDAQGAFHFEGVPAGRYVVNITVAGYTPWTVRETVTAGEAITVRYRLQAEQPVAPGVIDVLVEGERPPREVVKRTLTRDEIDMIPGTRGDALKSLQSLPGVARPPFIAGLLIVRGSAAQDTQAFIDGATIPLIYHFGGLSSVVPTEVLDRIDFYPGNYSAQYGRAMGGIVDVGLRSPKYDGYHGMAQLDFIDARFLFEGPIPTTDDWAFLVAARRSWVDAWLGPVLESASASVTQAPVYYDYQAMVEHKWNRGKLRFSFMGSDDAFELLNDTPPTGQPSAVGSIGLHLAFQRLQTSYEDTIGKRQRFRWMIAAGHDDVAFGIGQFFFNLNTYSIVNRIEYSNKLLSWMTVNAGLDYQAGITNVNLRVPTPPVEGQPNGLPFSVNPPLEVTQSRAFSRPALYTEVEMTPARGLRIVSGVRLDYALDTKKFDLQPRLNARYDIHSEFPRTTVKGGIGLYSQPPQFQESIDPLGTIGLSSNQAVHLGAGVEQDITQQLEVSAEFFYKYLDSLVSGGFVSGYANEGSGYAVGGEFLLKYKPDDRFFGWLAYTLSRSIRQRNATAEAKLASFDQTHNLTVLGSVKLGRGWTLGARFRLASGNLDTPKVCAANNEGCDPNAINAIYYGPAGTYSSLPSGGNLQERLPLFHRLDVRMDKKWTFDDWAFTFYLDVQNIYNNQASEAITYNYNFTDRSYVSGLPILPSIGLRGQY